MREYVETVADAYNEFSRELLNKVDAGKSVHGTFEITDAHITILHNKRQQHHIISKRRKQSKRYIAAELLWYLSRSRRVDFIGKYANKWNTILNEHNEVESNYGYWMFSSDAGRQWQNVVSLLQRSPDTRRAQIMLSPNRSQLDAFNIKDLQCTIYLGFQVRDGELDMFTRMRSNDVVFGFGNDAPVFMTLQELMALQLGVKVGRYHHAADSLHVYINDIDRLDTESTAGTLFAEPTAADVKVFEWLTIYDNKTISPVKALELFKLTESNLFNSVYNLIGGE